jgi:acyl carrier protein
MTRSEFLRKFEGLLEIPPEPGSLTGAEPCADIEGWDSLAMLSYIAMLDKDFGLKVAPQKVFKCQTVNDLVDLVAERLDS